MGFFQSVVSGGVNGLMIGSFIPGAALPGAAFGAAIGGVTSLLPFKSTAGGAVGGAAAGAATGAVLGSFFPVIGTGIGAAVGAIAGGLFGASQARENQFNAYQKQDAQQAQAIMQQFNAYQAQDALRAQAIMNGNYGFSQYGVPSQYSGFSQNRFSQYGTGRCGCRQTSQSRFFLRTETAY